MSDAEKSGASGSEGEEDAYEVEKIISHKKVKGTVLYEVKWKGYSLEETTWEPEDNLDGSQEMLDEYKEIHDVDGKSKVKKEKKTKGRDSSKIEDDDDDEFIVTKVVKEPKAKKARKSKGTVDSDESDEDAESAPKANTDHSLLPPASECVEVISAGVPKKTPADVAAGTRYFLVKFSQDRKLLVPAQDCQAHYAQQLCAFLLKKVDFREGVAVNGNGNGHQSGPDSD